MSRCVVQPYGSYAVSQLGGAEMDEARTRLAAMMNVETDELSFGPSTSQNTYVLAHAFAETLSPGDVVIVTDQDHEANSGAWRRLEARGMEVREWQINDETGQLETETLAGLLDEKVKLVCFTHCSNIIGQENPVPEIVAMAHAVGAVTCVDGVSMAPHGFADVGWRSVRACVRASVRPLTSLKNISYETDRPILTKLARKVP